MNLASELLEKRGYGDELRKLLKNGSERVRRAGMQWHRRAVHADYN
jgi:hypothetical protein